MLHETKVLEVVIRNPDKLFGPVEKYDAILQPYMKNEECLPMGSYDVSINQDLQVISERGIIHFPDIIGVARERGLVPSKLRRSI